MKTNRQSKIIEIIQKNEVETQDELSALLEKDGFRVTQATVSRDIRELKLTKIPTAGGRQKYAVITDAPQNILVIKTVSGMASAVCAAIDAMKMREIVGSIAGDDTIMCAIRTVDDTYAVMKKIRRIVE